MAVDSEIQKDAGVSDGVVAAASERIEDRSEGKTTAILLALPATAWHTGPP